MAARLSSALPLQRSSSFNTFSTFGIGKLQRKSLSFTDGLTLATMRKSVPVMQRASLYTTFGLANQTQTQQSAVTSYLADRRIKEPLREDELKVLAYIQKGSIKEASEIVERMANEKNPAIPRIYVALFEAFRSYDSFTFDELVMKYLNQLIEINLKPHQTLYNVAMDYHRRRGDIENMVKYWNHMVTHEIHPDPTTLGMMIFEFQKRGDRENAEKFWTMVHLVDVVPKEFRRRKAPKEPQFQPL